MRAFAASTESSSTGLVYSALQATSAARSTAPPPEDRSSPPTIETPLSSASQFKQPIRPDPDWQTRRPAPAAGGAGSVIRFQPDPRAIAEAIFRSLSDPLHDGTPERPSCGLLRPDRRDPSVALGSLRAVGHRPSRPPDPQDSRGSPLADDPPPSSSTSEFLGVCDKAS